jgi:hypothetical protein
MHNLWLQLLCKVPFGKYSTKVFAVLQEYITFALQTKQIENLQNNEKNI